MTKKSRRGDNLKRDRNTATAPANRARTRMADQFAAELLHVLRRVVVEEGETRLTDQAAWLNAHGYFTRRKKPWSASTVKQVYKRIRERNIKPAATTHFLITEDDLSG